MPPCSHLLHLHQLNPLQNSQTPALLLVYIQQANDLWLSVSTSVKAFKKCCPNFLTTVTNIWATLIVIEFLKKYSSMMEELELVIIKAEQWLGKQVLPPDVNLVVLKDS